MNFYTLAFIWVRRHQIYQFALEHNIKKSNHIKNLYILNSCSTLFETNDVFLIQIIIICIVELISGLMGNGI